MILLALEFSTDTRSVALLRDGAVIAEAANSGGRATHAFALIDQVLRDAGVVREQVNRVAVGIGPGSSTGIRVAISIAQAWQLAHPVDLAALTSGEIAAARAAREWSEPGPLAVAVDAQRQEFHLGLFTAGPTEPPRLEAPWELATLDQVLAVATGRPGLRLLAWDAAVGRLPGALALAPDAATLARLAAGAPPADAAQLQPLHLRPTSYVKAPPPRHIPLP